MSTPQRESVASVLETEAVGDIAEIYSDIRTILGTTVVNLIWRNLATMPGALPWAWSAVRPLYLGPAPAHAEAVRRTLGLPVLAPLSQEALAVAGIDRTARDNIRRVLDSYHHTNALALVVLSALLETYDPSPAPESAAPWKAVAAATPTVLLPLPAMASLSADIQGLVKQLNEFGEDTDPFLIASMYRHLACWPPYLALMRTVLAPLQADGRLNRLTRSARSLGRAHGRALARQLAPGPPPTSLEAALASCRLFVEHPIARMTGICAILRRAMPEQASEATL